VCSWLAIQAPLQRLVRLNLEPAIHSGKERALMLGQPAKGGGPSASLVLEQLVRLNLEPVRKEGMYRLGQPVKAGGPSASLL